MLLISLLACCFACYVTAAAVGLERKRIEFRSAQEYALLLDTPSPEQITDNIQTPVIIPLDAPSTTFAVQARPTSVWRPRDTSALLHARLRSLHLQESEPVEWETVDMLGPDIEDKHTLSQLARMTGNAYAMPGQKNWYDIDQAWNTVCLSLYA
jgi:lipase ATG15